MTMNNNKKPFKPGVYKKPMMKNEGSDKKTKYNY